MSRRSYLPLLWIIYPLIWVLWIFIFPRFFPHVGGYGFFLPFVFFFPFFRRRGGRGSPTPVSNPPQRDAGQDKEEYHYENMLSEENYKPPYPLRNYIFYAIGAIIIIVGIVLVYMKIF